MTERPEVDQLLADLCEALSLAQPDSEERGAIHEALHSAYNAGASSASKVSEIDEVMATVPKRELAQRLLALEGECVRVAADLIDLPIVGDHEILRRAAVVGIAIRLHSAAQARKHEEA